MQSSENHSCAPHTTDHSAQLVDMKMSIPQITRVKMRSVYNSKDLQCQSTQIKAISNLTSDSEPEAEEEEDCSLNLRTSTQQDQE